MNCRVVVLKIRYFECLTEPAHMFASALREAGLRARAVVVSPDTYAPIRGTQDILLGAHAAPEIWSRLPPRTTSGELDGMPGTPAPIVYQTENLLRAGRLELPDWWPAMTARATLWEYSAMHAMLLRVRHVPLGYVPSCTRRSQRPYPDLDVLFYGSINPRRNAVLERMRALGLRVEVVFGVFGPALDALIARSKVVLNVHFYEPGLFEAVRVMPLLHRGVCVLSENSCDGDGRLVCTSVTYDNLPDVARALTQGDCYAVQAAGDHARLCRQRPMSALLREALGLNDARAATAALASPQPA
jgi:hypothetical protein